MFEAGRTLQRPSTCPANPQSQHDDGVDGLGTSCATSVPTPKSPTFHHGDIASLHRAITDSGHRCCRTAPLLCVAHVLAVAVALAVRTGLRRDQAQGKPLQGIERSRRRRSGS